MKAELKLLKAHNYEFIMHAKKNENEKLITRKGKVPKIKFGTTETHDNIENVVQLLRMTVTAF